MSICCDLIYGFGESPNGDFEHTGTPVAIDMDPLTGKRTDIIEQQLHHSVWPPSPTENNTHFRNRPPQRKSEALPGQTEPPTREGRKNENSETRKGWC